jgi:CheY-like chemotaxis protein
MKDDGDELRCIVIGSPPCAARCGGVTFCWAASTGDAEAAIRTGGVDAVVVDVTSAPGVGWAALRRLTQAAPQVPTIAIAQPEQMPEAVRCGARGLLASWTDPEVVAAEVRTAVARHRATCEALRLSVLAPLLQLRELVPADPTTEGVLRRLAEITLAALGADCASVVTLSPHAQDLSVAVARKDGREPPTEGYWTLAPRRLTSVGTGEVPGEAEGGRVLTVPVATAGYPIGALTVSRNAAHPSFDAAERALLSLLGIVGALPIAQVSLLEQLRESNENLINALTHACELHEASLRGHGERLASYAVAIGQRMGFGHSQLEDLRVAGMLHDVGKIGISDSILLKPSPLTPEEYEIVKRHAVLGAEILASAHFGDDVVRWVRHHHERWDGRGYPDGLAGEEIPLGSRILAVADAYEVMTTGRPYRAARSPHAAIAELVRERGTQFDPEVVDVFTDVVGRNEVVVGPAVKS